MDEVRGGGLCWYVYGVACGCVRAMRRIESSRRNASASGVGEWGSVGAAWGVGGGLVWRSMWLGVRSGAVVGVAVEVVGGGLVWWSMWCWWCWV